MLHMTPIVMHPLDAMMSDMASMLGHHHALRACNSRAVHLNNGGPRVDEHPDKYEVTISAPGVKTQDLCLEMTGRTLRIVGETVTNTHTHFIDWSVNLPRDAHAETAEATHVDGVLAITLPKAPAAEAVRVDLTTPSDDDDKTAADAYTLSLNAAGIAKADLELSILDSTLKVSGETKRTGAKLARTYQIPRDVDASRATATHVDGILSVTLPKKAVAEPTATFITVTAPPEHEATEATKDAEDEEEKATPLPPAAPSDDDEEDGVMV